jgi:histidinol phosphatase-like PHP family hydrolase
MERCIMTDTPQAADPEPMVLAFSDGRHFTLKPDLTRWIWKEVARGRYSGPWDMSPQASWLRNRHRANHHTRQAKLFLFEINSSPARLDLSAENARMANCAGLKVAVSTDAHSTREFGTVRYGIDQARRAGLEKGSIFKVPAMGVASRTLQALDARRLRNQPLARSAVRQPPLALAATAHFS